MTAWEIIKRELMGDKIPGTTGAHRRLNIAAQIFFALLPYLKDIDSEKVVFNADEEVREAILNKRYLNELYGKDLIGTTL